LKEKVLKGEFKRGFAPLSNPYLPLMQGITYPYHGEGDKGGEVIKVDTKGESKRGFAPLQKNLPLPLNKGKGIKGIGLIK